MTIPFCTGFVVLAASALLRAVTLADSAETEWQEIKKLCNPALIPAPPESWEKEPPSAQAYEEWRDAERKELQEIDKAAHDFYTRHPEHPHASSAMILREVVATLETNLDAAIGEGGDTPISAEDVRYLRHSGFLICQARTPDALASTARKLKAKYPRQQAVYTLMLSAATELSPGKARELLNEVIESESANEAHKVTARKVLATLDRIGQPLEMTFTTLDGKTIHTPDLKGKVVLIDFRVMWGTPNDATRASLALLKSAYEKHHAAGLEIITVALADDLAALEKHTKEEHLPWPHHFDGGFREPGKLRTEYEVIHDSDFYLLDREGVLRFIDGRKETDRKITTLLTIP